MDHQMCHMTCLGHMTTPLNPIMPHSNIYRSHITTRRGHITILRDHMTIQTDHMTNQQGHMTSQQGHMTTLADHMIVQESRWILLVTLMNSLMYALQDFGMHRKLGKQRKIEQ